MDSQQWLNTKKRFGWGSIALHWLVAVALIGVYLLGEYMVDLGYYDPWYHDSLAIHKAIGMLLGIVLVLRYMWNRLQVRPAPLHPEAKLPVILAKLAHALLYLLPLIMVVSGYLISTSKGQGIDVFGWFEIPALLADSAERGEWAAEVHEISGFAFLAVLAAHVVGALAHHFMYRDDTLKRIVRASKP